MISQTAEYALRAALHLAEHGGDGPVRVDDVAEALDVPRNYLSKIMHALVRAGVMTSTRGPGGGFQLARSPAELRLIEVVREFGNVENRGECLLGRASCSDLDPCAAHERWRAVAGAVHAFFADTTLDSLRRDADTLASGTARA